MKKIIITIILLFPLNIHAITASSYIVMDTDNNRILEGNNIHKQSLIASITKIMTSIVVINNIDINKQIEVSNNVLKSYGSGIYITPGEHLTIKELLYGLMLRSGNDAAIELAYQVGESEEGFAYLMNQTAKSLQMNNTNFINPSGLEYKDEANKSSVYDMALLSSYAIKNPIYKEIVGTKQITIKTDLKTYIWHNKNKLLTNYKYTTGGKTGYTKKAKRTLVTTATKDNINLTIVTFNDPNDFTDHKELYEKYFKKLKNYQILKKGKIKTNLDNTYIEENYNMSLTKEEYNKLKLEINYYNENISNIVGQVIVKLNNQEYFKTNIIQKNNQQKQTLIQKIINKIIGR